MASPKSGIKRLVHKHESWLTFAGAFIVFITFVVKEGLGEHWRATADALNAARYTFELKKQSSETRADIEELRHYVQTRKSLTESIAENVPGGVSGFEYERLTFFTWFNENLAGARDMLQDASIIADKLPRDDKEAQKVSSLRAEIPKAEKESSEIQRAAELIDFLNDVDTGKHETRGDNLTAPLTNEPPTWVYHSFQRPPFSRIYKGETHSLQESRNFQGPFLTSGGMPTDWHGIYYCGLTKPYNGMNAGQRLRGGLALCFLRLVGVWRSSENSTVCMMRTTENDHFAAQSA